MFRAKLNEQGFVKMQMNGFNKTDLPEFGVIESVDSRTTPFITYIVFEGITRKDGKRRFGFIEGDFVSLGFE